MNQGRLTTRQNQHVAFFGWRLISWLAGLLWMLNVAALAAPVPLEITNVRADPHYFVPPKEETHLHFQLSASATVTVHFYDGQDRLVRTLTSPTPLTAGDHTLDWDGTDQRGQPLPPEEYRYTLTAEDANGQHITYDLSDLTGGEDVLASDVAWDPEVDMIRYRLPQAARVNIRVGLGHGGPLLGTVLDWVVRDAGVHQESWNGFDASQVLDLSHHPELMVSINAFALSANALIIGPPAATVQTLTDLPWGETRRVPQRQPAKRMYAHYQQPLTERRDFKIQLRLPANLPTTSDQIPIVSETVALSLDIDPHDRTRALDQRFETVFYVDGLFAFESETGFLPMTWQWNSQGINEGTHFLTANLRGYEGHFGMATIKVYVRPPGATPETKTP